MGLAARVKRLLLGSPPPAIPTRLTSIGAIALAKEAAGDHWLARVLNVATPQRGADGAVVWIVETGGVGASLRIVLDDATGAVIERVDRPGR